MYGEKKNVCILSTMHRSAKMYDNPKKHPKTVNFYNFTKGGVDILDQMN